MSHPLRYRYHRHHLVISTLVVGLALAGCGDGGSSGDGSNQPVGGGTSTETTTPGIVIKAENGLKTTEAGGQVKFSVVLKSKPSANVRIPLSSSNTKEGSVRPTSITFTPSNWDAPQTVIVTGVNDDDADGTVAYTIETGRAQSDDTDYDGMNADDVPVSNVDNDTAGVTVTAKTALVTSEAREQSTFAVALNSKPTADVVIELTSSDLSEGVVSPSKLTFTVDNWNAVQTVVVTGVDDQQMDGEQAYTITTSAVASNDKAYDGMAVDDVDVKNTDNDTAGITVTAESDLATTEAGGQKTFTVVLNSEPTADVVLSVGSSDTTEGTVSASSLTFTAANWNAPQTVTVTGQDDLVADGNQPYNVVIGPAASMDASYNEKTVPNVTVTNTDNDSAGITVTAESDLATTEAGGQKTFTVVLNSKPTADVVLHVGSSDTTEGTVSASSLTFTAANWNAPQTITVTGQDDLVADGNQPYNVVIGPAVSTDTGYNEKTVPNVTVTNTDNDSAGITVTAESDLATTEAGGQKTFTVVLNSEPTADVVLHVGSSDTTEGTVSASSLTFTAANWNAPQTITVTGQDDLVADGNQPYNVVIGPAVSTDTGYNEKTVPNVTVTNTDNDSAGITVTAESDLATTEAGGQKTFTVVLNSEPTADVVLSVGSSDTTEGTVGESSLTFTAANWNAPQTVTITGVNDFVADGNQPFNVVIGPAVSTDTGYNEKTVPNVTVTNTDNDSAGITVTAAAGLATTEAGGQKTFTVVLNSEPTADVVLSVGSSDTTEGSVGESSLTFTAANWNAPQTVTITGVNDFVADGNQPYNIVMGPAVSSDAGYSGKTVPNVAVTNTDNDSAGITVTAAAGLATTEAGGQKTFTVVLNSEPTANVVLSVGSSDTTEGTVGASSLTFTAANWNAPQTITITGVNDFVADGNQPYNIVIGSAVSSDAGYSGKTVPNVAVTNTDNDSAGITVTAAAGLATTEAGGQKTFTVVLNSEPTANVVLSVGSSDTTEGTVGASSLTFTAANWNAPQTVTITGVNDFVADGNQPYNIVMGPAVSSDAGYSGKTVPNVAVTNTDNDSAGITVTAAAGLATTEAGGQKTYTVVLNSEPTANVVLSVASSDTTEGTVGASSLTFTAANWNAPQTVTITGVNDFVADGNQPYNIVMGPAVSSDAGYSGKTVPNVVVTNTDNDTAGITVTPSTDMTTTEAGGQKTFTVVLNSEPTANVVLSVASSDTTEGTVGASSLTFTAANWNTAQTVTITGVNDFVADGNQPYNIVVGPAVSSDAGYSGKTVPNVVVTNTDNDTAGITVTPSADMTTTEAGGQKTFTVVLNSEPTANVVLSVASSDTTEGTVSASSLTFTVANWNTARTITVTGVDDALSDGNQTYSILIGPAVSADAGYSGKTVPNVAMTNTDNDLLPCGPSGESCASLSWVYKDYANARGWAWASPCSGGCSLVSVTGANGHTMQGWRFPTNADWAVRPNASVWGSGATVGCASTYFDATFNHCDWNDPVVQSLDSGSSEIWLVHDM